MADAVHSDQPYITLEEYFETLEKSDWRYEWYDGMMWPVGNPDNLPQLMAGGSPAHSRLAANIIRHLGNSLDNQPCDVLTSDTAVRVEASGLLAFPDVAVACEDADYQRERSGFVLLNPVVIVEVLSPSTANFDRGDKFAHYRLIPSLRHYLIVFPDQVRVEHHQWQENGQWTWEELTSLTDVVALTAVSAEITLEQIYDRVPPSDPIRQMPRPRIV